MTLLFPKPKAAPKKRVPEAERDYMRRVSMLPCAVCGCIPVEVHHWICGRGSQRRTSNWQTIPLCDRHHLGKFDIRGPAIHQQRVEWVEWFGLDTDYIADTQAKVKEHFGIEVPEEWRWE